MNCATWNEKLHDYADEVLPPAETHALEAHLAGCESCRAELASLRALLVQAQSLPREIPPPHDLWPDIEAKGPDSPRNLVTRGSHRRWLPYVTLAVAAGIVFAVVVRLKNGPDPSPAETAWSVASVSGTPRVDRKNFQGQARLRVGQWLETDSASSAKLDVGSIGEVNIAPNSRLRLVDTSATDHRVELARGTLRALIWAPPRLFFVNTPSATAIDLGCAYTLSVDDDGAGLLHVTSGYVALEHDGRESIIPAGFKCATRQRFGPGTPFAADAPDALRAALARFDFGKAGVAALRDVLASARAEDAITLWHLLARAGAEQRGEIFDALARSHAVPAGVTRAGIIAGDSAMRAAWARELGFGSFLAR